MNRNVPVFLFPWLNFKVSFSGDRTMQMLHCFIGSGFCPKVVQSSGCRNATELIHRCSNTMIYIRALHIPSSLSFSLNILGLCGWTKPRLNETALHCLSSAALLMYHLTSAAELQFTDLPARTVTLLPFLSCQ